MPLCPHCHKPLEYQSFTLEDDEDGWFIVIACFNCYWWAEV